MGKYVVIVIILLIIIMILISYCLITALPLIYCEQSSFISFALVFSGISFYILFNSLFARAPIFEKILGIFVGSVFALFTSATDNT